MSTTTLWRRLNKLEKVGRISLFSDMKKEILPTSNGGAKETTLYDLTVFSKLAMTFIDNPRAVEMRKTLPRALNIATHRLCASCVERKTSLSLMGRNTPLI